MTTIPTQSFGSQQLRLFRRAIRDGASLEQAAALGNYTLATAKLIVADDTKNPPPEAAYELLYDPDAPADASSNKEAHVAKEYEAGEYKRPDAAMAFKIYDTAIKPKEARLATIKGDMSEPYNNIKDQAHFPRKVLNFIVSLENAEDAKRDHMLLALADGLKHRKLFLPRDLVTLANGEQQSDIVGTEERDDDELLVDEDDDEQSPVEAKHEVFTEAAPEELEKQAGRKPRRTARTATVTSITPPSKPSPESRAH